MIISLGRQIGSGMSRFLGVIVFGPLADFISLKDLVTACCSRLGFSRSGAEQSLLKQKKDMKEYNNESSRVGRDRPSE